MKTLLFKLGQYLTSKFAPPKACKCHIDHRACGLHYKGDLEAELLKLFPDSESPDSYRLKGKREWCRDWLRGWIEFVRGDCTGRPVEEFDICVDGNIFIGFESTDTETLRAIYLILRQAVGRSVKSVDTSKRNTFNIVTAEIPKPE